MTARWPDVLPGVDAPGYTLSPVDPSRRTDMEVGARRVRRITRARQDRAQVSWTLTDSEMAAFRAWHGDEPWSLAGDSDSLAAWAPRSVTVTADAIAGPGPVLADRITETTANDRHEVALSLGAEVLAGAQLLFRATLKSAGRTWARLWFQNRDGTICYSTVNLATGAWGVTGGLLTRTIEDRGDGWWRVTQTADVGTGVTSPALRLQLLSDSQGVVYAGSPAAAVDVCEISARLVTGHDLYLPTASDGTAVGAAGGAGWFLTNLFYGGGWRLVEARFDGPFKAEFLDGANWRVSAGLEVRDA